VPGRAFAVATGLKAARPDLSVWVSTGDGDALSAGANHLLHALRRNVDLKILCFNNEVFGLTKGQASPVSRPGTRTRTTPQGSAEQPVRPASFALAAEASFVARTLDVDAEHFTAVVTRAARHRGSAFIEVYQNCNVFNDGAFEYATDPSSKAESTIMLEHGKPLVFGKDRRRGVRLNGLTPEVVALGSGVPLDDVLVHDETAADGAQAWITSRMAFPDYPECFGVFRAVERATYEDVLRAPPPQPSATLQELLVGDDSWTVS
jgi:2-oxoglutarate/2-oxoacid ferredoxin oxidoreductase subunit beta